MSETVREYSGRTFSEADIELIINVCKQYKHLSLAELVATVCELLSWTTPRGLPKRVPCESFLESLEAEGLVCLPAKRKKRHHRQRQIPVDQAREGALRTGEVRDYQPIQLQIVEKGKDLPLWRAYVERYHMLGDKTAFGSSLYYFIRSGEEKFGCLQFSASAWALEARDTWLGWSLADRKARLHLIVNNSRFLIFPWIQIHNLASHVLGQVSRQIQTDWLEKYCYAPVLLETFVDLEHFRGTCYKAANWIYLGETQGRGRMDRDKAYALSRKAIFMYPLQKDYRACLLGQKPPLHTEALI